MNYTVSGKGSYLLVPVWTGEEEKAIKITVDGGSEMMIMLPIASSDKKPSYSAPVAVVCAGSCAQEHTAVLSAVIISVCMTMAGILLSPLVLRLISVPESVFELADSYLRIYFGGISFLILYNIGSGILRALGDSKRPLYFLVFSSLVNIALDFLFVLGFKWGIKGAAWATVISEAISVLPVFFVLMKSDDVFKVRLKNLRIDLPDRKSVV